MVNFYTVLDVLDGSSSVCMDFAWKQSQSSGQLTLPLGIVIYVYMTSDMCTSLLSTAGGALLIQTRRPAASADRALLQT